MAVQRLLERLPTRPTAAKPQDRWLAAAYEWTESILLAVAVVLLLFSCVLRTATVSGPSMVPTLQSGDRVLIWQLGCQNLDYGEIVVVDRTTSAQPPIVKRVIGKAGDVIDIDLARGK